MKPDRLTLLRQHHEALVALRDPDMPHEGKVLWLRVRDKAAALLALDRLARERPKGTGTARRRPNGPVKE